MAPSAAAVVLFLIVACFAASPELAAVVHGQQLDPQESSRVPSADMLGAALDLLHQRRWFLLWFVFL
jgi:hypothetical protein